MTGCGHVLGGEGFPSPFPSGSKTIISDPTFWCWQEWGGGQTRDGSPLVALKCWASLWGTWRDTEQLFLKHRWCKTPAGCLAFFSASEKSAVYLPAGVTLPL